MRNKQKIISVLKKHFSGLQAVYLFGSIAAHDEHPGSDVDIAVLLSPDQSGLIEPAYFFDVRCELEKVLNKNADLINLRKVNTVLQKEVITNGKRIYCPDEYAAEEFEMLVYSAYQKLSRERAGIVDEIIKSSRVLRA